MRLGRETTYSLTPRPSVEFPEHPPGVVCRFICVWWRVLGCVFPVGFLFVVGRYLGRVLVGVCLWCRCLFLLAFWRRACSFYVYVSALSLIARLYLE